MASECAPFTVSTGEYLEKLQLTWKIVNFDHIRRSEELIRKQKINIKMAQTIDNETEWCCYLLPIKNESNVQEELKQVGIYLKLTKAPSSKELIASFCVKITKLNRTLSKCIKNFIVDGKPCTDGWGYVRLLPEDVSSEQFLTNGDLMIEVELQVLPVENKDVPQSPHSIEQEHKLNFSDKLRLDMTKLLMEPVKSSDAETKIISREGVEVTVNRGVLSARSTVFELMFQADMKESKTGLVKITDLSSDTITVLLHFLYTGTLHQNWTCAGVLPEFLYAAGKYQLADLLAFFDDVTGTVCCKENAGRLVGHARKLGLKRAELELVDFIKRNITSLDDIVSFAEDCATSNFA